MIEFSSFPVIETKNLTLRRMEHKDINDIFSMRKDPRMHEYTDSKPDETSEETKAYIDKMNKGIDDNKWIIWAIEHKQTKKVIGSISIWNIDKNVGSGELGYGIIPDYQGKGYMKEALLEVIGYGFEVMKLKALDSYTEESNTNSIKLLENCKFNVVNRVDDEGFCTSRIYHMVVYRIEKSKKYIIKPLTPELAETFADYLGNLDFGHAPHWSTCFCRFYQTSCSHQEWQNRTGEQNRKEALEQIREGRMKGFMAFDGDVCIGWCNANDMHEYLRLADSFSHLDKNQRVACAICFVIHPQYRGSGVARLLLKSVIETYKQQGYDAVIGLPIDMSSEPQKQYRGTLNMYKEYGFEEIEKHDTLSVMWLKLQIDCPK